MGRLYIVEILPLILFLVALARLTGFWRPFMCGVAVMLAFWLGAYIVTIIALTTRHMEYALLSSLFMAFGIFSLGIGIMKGVRATRSSLKSPRSKLRRAR